MMVSHVAAMTSDAFDCPTMAFRSAFYKSLTQGEALDETLSISLRFLAQAQLSELVSQPGDNASKGLLDHVVST